MNTYGVEKGTTIRQPSTANLMIDSMDRVFNASANQALLTFTNTQAFANGFFTRVSLPEMVLTSRIPNVIGKDISGFQFAVDISGTSSGTICCVPNGFYTVAEFIDAVAASMNATGLFGTVSVVTNNINVTTPRLSSLLAIQATGGFRFSAVQPQDNYIGTIASLLGVPLGGAFTVRKPIGITPRLALPWLRYLDFVSPQLTYTQDLKDSNTTGNPYDVLMRWYYSRTDTQSVQDKYGFDIPYGSSVFSERRQWNPPKQIKWDSNLPLANFTVEVFYQVQGIANPPESFASALVDISQRTGIPLASLFDYEMTLQLSEN